jgi:DNA modification methylase
VMISEGRTLSSSRVESCISFSLTMKFRGRTELEVFYQSEFGKIYCANCLEVLSSIERKSVDLTVTSPPYDFYDGKRTISDPKNSLRAYEGYQFDFERVAQLLWRVTKNGGCIVWVVGDKTTDGSESGSSFRQVLYFLDIGFRLHDTMIFEKTGPTHPEPNRYHQVFEYMFVLSKGKPRVVNLLRDRRNAWRRSWGRRTQRGRDGSLRDSGRGKVVYNEFGVRFNIWKIQTGKGFATSDEIAYEHPAIFPEVLARDHIRTWSNEGDLVLDPFLGSGTTAKMAEKLRRKWVGIDCSQRYCEIAKARVEPIRQRGSLNL